MINSIRAFDLDQSARVTSKAPQSERQHPGRQAWPLFGYRVAACKARRSFAAGIDRWRSHRSQEVIVLIKSMDTVIGPTPPGLA
jgi:hypothetical protein